MRSENKSHSADTHGAENFQGSNRDPDLAASTSQDHKWRHGAEVIMNGILMNWMQASRIGLLHAGCKNDYANRGEVFEELAFHCNWKILRITVFVFQVLTTAKSIVRKLDGFSLEKGCFFLTRDGWGFAFLRIYDAYVVLLSRVCLYANVEGFFL